MPDEEQPLLGRRDRHSRAFSAAQEREGALALRFADQEGKAAARRNEALSRGEHLIEMLDRPQGDQLGLPGGE